MKTRILLAALFICIAGFSTGVEPGQGPCGLYSLLTLRPTQTTQGERPESYFASPTEGEGKAARPRFVMLIGPPGAGKSVWADTAKKNGWTVIGNDAIRLEILAQLRAEKKTVTPYPGLPELADPANGQHHRALDRDLIDQIVNERVQQAIRSKSPIVLDWLNHVPRLRVPHLVACRKAGYFTDALVFESRDAAVNLRNIKKRIEQGGVDVFPGRDEANLKSIRRILDDMKADPMKVGPGPARHADDYVDRRQDVEVRDWSSGG